MMATANVYHINVLPNSGPQTVDYVDDNGKGLVWLIRVPGITAQGTTKKTTQ